jgi:ribosomal protein S18 acetylase RimI-like enzyme
MSEMCGGSEILRWRKMKKRDAAGLEALLHGWEGWYVAACARFLKRGSKDHVWTLNGRGGSSALIVQSKRTLLPVFFGRKDIPPPSFLRSLFSALKIHSLQGLKNEAVTLEHALAELDLRVKEQIDYDLMFIDRTPAGNCFCAGPRSLILRRPGYTDMDALAALQAGYEQEEVLPRGAVFYPAASRINTEHILANQQILVAELSGRLVGKINTSARSFTRFQVGGVYVHPDFRGLGIARRMAAEFIHSLITQGRGVTLFVKKSNAAARSVYRGLGFETLADYRISYF